ncbi:hypothetical protein Nepgr_022529 [Nepenthes gracilis]|uniref:Proline dehydrogenase n=1 Tax=Nepenthes gracilis TaxID=150966 RepID=A0AAD3SZ16_NEPGR|nr:hypothetical protein Nepgr_022529 [Nepenthes gracilis]
MAIRISPKLLRQFTRPLSSTPSSTVAAVSPLNLDEKPGPEPEPTTTIPKPPIINAQSYVLDFHDVGKLFSSVLTAKLLRSTVNLHAVAIDPMVDIGIWVMRSKLMETPVIRDVILSAIKHTFYEQFVAGKDLEETGRTVRKIWDAELRAMLFYGSEHAHDNESCDRNFEAYLTTVESSKSLPPSSVSFMVVKISAICPISLLESVSNLLRWQKKEPSFSLPWKLDTLPIFSDSSPLYHTLEKPDPLTREEEIDLELGHQRLLNLCRRCAELNIPLSVDAEETKVQPAIDYLTYSAAIMINEGGHQGHPIVFGTMQAYLKDARERMLLVVNGARKIGVPVGFKLVRGAYMASERKVAASMGFESPIHGCIEDTHACYNDCASFMLDKVAHGFGGVVLATHNIESGRLAAKRARDLGIGKENERIQFAQLYGMSETLSFGLKNAGFRVSKYLTFGPVAEVMPFLLRRAEENRGLLSSSSLDRQLMRKELSRRLMAGFLR